MSTDSTHTLQFCCGTSCDAQANLEYVKELEQDRHQLRADLAAAAGALRLARRGYEELSKRHAHLDMMFTVMLRLHPLEVKHGPTKGDTRGTTR